MSHKNYDLIVWDLDGTLVDSLKATFDAFNYALEPIYNRTLSPEELLSHFGPPDQEILRKLAGDTHYPQALQRMLQFFKGGLSKMTPFEGIVPLLHHNRSIGKIQGIFTGRGRVTTDLIVEELQLRDHFVRIVTNDDCLNHKPHPEGLEKVITAAKVSPKRTLMVGDSVADLKAARAAGCAIASVTWDLRAHSDRLKSYKPDHFFSSVSEMKEWLSG